MKPKTQDGPAISPGEGWHSLRVRFCLASVMALMVSGLAITVGGFRPWIQWTVLVHTILGGATLVPVVWYCVVHVLAYRRHALSSTTLFGWIALAGVVVASISGIVLTVQALVGTRTSVSWRNAHFAATLGLVGGMVPHLAAALWRQRKAGPVMGWPWGAASMVGGAALVTAICLGLPYVYSGTGYTNAFPADYSYLYGTNRPFAPSLARTDTGGAFDARTLAGSHACGTAGCHEQILEEWQPSAHRYAAMDRVFLGIQDVMARENGAESTRYCGGCHDPISLFSGTKNIFVENLTGLHGYQEGISCLACHAIRETDIKGNANYTVTQPTEYLWQWETNGVRRLLRDFLIRSIPGEHQKLSKRSFKKPEYCAACHKQFIDEEINRVGWVQLQNQYDNWASSRWNHKGDAKKTVECRECHMPLVASRDPARGDLLDYNRSAEDGKHRSHRFLGANTIIPTLQAQELPGWEKHLKLTESWLQGTLAVPEIAEKWASGPIVRVLAVAPSTVAPGADIQLRVVMASTKVGHDFPTGPLDIIQSWLAIRVTDDAGRVVWTSGQRDARNFLEPGTFLFKAEPVDQHGNLIDRHNLWEMVGVRFRRALFPGHSDSVSFSVPCSGASPEAGQRKPADDGNGLELAAPIVQAPSKPGSYHIDVSLEYRKVDQFLLNHLFGSTNTFTAPVTQIARTNIVVRVAAKEDTAAGGAIR